MGEEDLEQMEGDVQDSLEDIQYDKVTHWGRWSVPGLLTASVADPYLWLTDPDPAPYPTIFVIDLQDANKKFFRLLLFEGAFTVHHFQR